MFEQEAKEYEDKHSIYDETFDMVFVNCSTKQTFQDAAAFGYNKGKSEAVDIIKRLMHELVVSNIPYSDVELLVSDVEQFLKEED